MAVAVFAPRDQDFLPILWFCVVSYATFPEKNAMMIPHVTFCGAKKNAKAGVPVLNKLCTMHQMREVTYNMQASWCVSRIKLLGMGYQVVLLKKSVL